MGDISLNFDRDEFECPCGCGTDTVDTELVILAEDVRLYKGPFRPSSACRCIEHNETVQRAANPKYVPYSSKSMHMKFKAIDIKHPDPRALYDYLDGLYPDKYGLGVYSWGVHVDVRYNKARWNRVR